MTSPELSNIVCFNLDHRLDGYLSRREIRYSRYADDITMSAPVPSRLVAAKPFVVHIISDEGFQLNHRKTRFMGPCARRNITGIIISDTGAGIGRRVKRRLRATIHKYLRLPPDDSNTDPLRAHLNGWFAYLNAVDKPGLKQLARYTDRLCARLEIPISSTGLRNVF